MIIFIFNEQLKSFNELLAHVGYLRMFSIFKR